MKPVYQVVFLRPSLWAMILSILLGIEINLPFPNAVLAIEGDCHCTVVSANSKGH